MPPTSRSYAPLYLALILTGIAVALLYSRRSTTSVASQTSLPLSPLADFPDWRKLDGFQQTISRADFENLLNGTFTTGSAWEDFIKIDSGGVEIQTGSPAFPEGYRLSFAPGGAPRFPQRYWRNTKQLPPADPARPLEGIRIAIDPGHIGGEWAKIEERWFHIPPGTPVAEGDMTLLVANILKPQLEALGAIVTLVRENSQPVTLLRPEGLQEAATTVLRSKSDEGDAPTSKAIRHEAERLFYRTAEIRDRAQRVNQHIQPDLVVCLHFNAESWGNPAAPALVDNSHFHLLLNGGYSDDELNFADQRFAMLDKLLQGTHTEEVAIAEVVATTFATLTGLPPFLYPPNSKTAKPVKGNPYLWARNLLANRLYECPVIFTEPYVMNSVTDYARIQAGDYPGTRLIAGILRPSIYQEYASGIATGLKNYYSTHRSLRD